MMKDCEFNDRTMIIVSLAICVGVGLTQTSGNFFAAFPTACRGYLQWKCGCGSICCFPAAEPVPAETENGDSVKDEKQCLKSREINEISKELFGHCFCIGNEPKFGLARDLGDCLQSRNVPFWHFR